MARRLTVSSKTILSMLAREFDFSFDLTKNRQKIQKTIYILQAGGFNSGQVFGWYISGPWSYSLFEDCNEVFHSPQDYKGTKKWGFNKETKRTIREIKKNFLEPANNLKKLEILTSAHFMMNIWPSKEDSNFLDFKNRFYGKKKSATLGYCTQNNDKWQKITQDELKNAWAQATKLIDYRKFNNKN